MNAIQPTQHSYSDYFLVQLAPAGQNRQCALTDLLHFLNQDWLAVSVLQCTYSPLLLFLPYAVS